VRSAAEGCLFLDHFERSRHRIARNINSGQSVKSPRHFKGSGDKR